MIQFGSKEMVPQMKEIWKECFGDPDDYIDFYFTHRYRDENTLIWREKGRALGMLTMFPCSLKQGDNLYNGRYVYAVATHPSAQGRGVSTRLLDGMHLILIGKRMDFSVLVPAGEKLFSFYEKRGYQKDITMTLCKEQPEFEQGTDSWTVQPLELAPFVFLRSRLFPEGCIQWGGLHLRYLLEEQKITGGEALLLSHGPKKAYAFCTPREDHILIKELGVEPSEREQVLSTLNSRYHKPLWVRERPQKEEGVPFGMTCWYREKPELERPYISLVLD